MSHLSSWMYFVTNMLHLTVASYNVVNIGQWHNHMKKNLPFHFLIGFVNGTDFVVNHAVNKDEAKSNSASLQAKELQFTLDSYSLLSINNQLNKIYNTTLDSALCYLQNLLFKSDYGCNQAWSLRNLGDVLWAAAFVVSEATVAIVGNEHRFKKRSRGKTEDLLSQNSTTSTIVSQGPRVSLSIVSKMKLLFFQGEFPFFFLNHLHLYIHSILTTF